MNAMSPTRRVRWSSLHKRDPNFGIVHANCIKFIRIVDERQRQLKLRLEKQQQTAIDVAQMFELERAQLKAKIRRLSLENQAVLDEFRKVREQVASLQQQLDGANTDVQNRIIRKELEQAIHFTLSSVIQTVARIIGESQIE
ncbi:hypothetical protein N7478_002265 [Penicillium angulare]|uniref:uncharacterized protein n=1 Tax=Penicillium angulare TaxID=116970 RepID=UPI00254064D8|nr:uncharacterized protein N7478_002265 [Penicillium angulare]KAJ5289235.1 hypothetical protein N7478_002265 [Penicillium angulare]